MPTEYVVSIRICFPELITRIIKKEKDRFVAEYGSSYKSEPHITLYLENYTLSGFPKLIHDLREIKIKPFTVELLKPTFTFEENRHRNLYVIDVPNKEQIQNLHDKISEIAIRYQSQIPRSNNKIFNPHITLGAVDIDNQQPNLADVENNLKELEGTKINVSNLVVVFDGKKETEEKFSLIEKVLIPLYN